MDQVGPEQDWLREYVRLKHNLVKHTVFIEEAADAASGTSGLGGGQHHVSASTVSESSILAIAQGLIEDRES